MQATTFIYARLEPDTDEIRYIGKANDPEKRLLCHISESKRFHTYCSNWINSIVARGLAPRTEIIAEVPLDEWPFWEQHFIKYFRDAGFDLVNATVGGEGVVSTAAIRAKQSAAMTGGHHTAETRGRMRSAAIGRKHSVETRAKIQAAHLGKLKRNSTSKFVGVHRDSHRGMWRALVENKRVGRFPKIEDAVFARALILATR